MFLLYPSFISDPSFEKSTTKTANYFPFITLSQIPQKQQRITQNQNYQKVFSLFTVNQIYEGENQYSCSLHVHIFAFLLIMTYMYSYQNVRVKIYLERFEYGTLGGQSDLLKDSICMSPYYRSNLSVKSSYLTSIGK